MEAPPNRPGHVGHTPQPVADMLGDSRLAGVLTSALLNAAADTHDYAMQAFPRLQAPEKLNTLLVSIQVERTRQTLSRLQPWPAEFEPGFAPSLQVRR